ncbi:hypothetical protein [Actinomadura chibensis]|uniref:ATP/GTP-binding protein n=1 Tax=Actinomadura chibensis TaxID=392828 RepID=A0A5D0NR86_9ACTN|nr:hypothetical protein [Actinomadura chibensis]TYB46611.1 hypothetical protein FXF69_15450 [Actinomadura chibensis]
MPPHPRTRRRAAAATITATALAIPLSTAVPAQAAPCHKTGTGGTCNVVVRVPGSHGGGGGGTGGGSGGGGPVLPPPPEGLTPDEAQGFVPAPGGPAPLQAAPTTTADLVLRARAATEFPVPVVHTAPKDKTYVALKTSLWVDGYHDVETEPISEGGQTVQLKGTVQGVVWDLGEKQIKCEDGGTEDGRTCHYAYTRSSAGQPDGKYQITATITWSVAWTCDGAACDAAGGTLDGQTMTSAPSPLVVSEIQTNTGQ